MLSLNDDNTFEKQHEDIYLTRLEDLKKENNSNSCGFLDIHIHIENGEFHIKLFEKQDNLGFNIVKMPFYCCGVHGKMLYESIGAEFLRISRATSESEGLSHSCKQLLLKQNGQMRRIKFSLIKMIQQHLKILIKYN